MATQTWRNWAGTQTARPVRIERPRDAEGVALAVQAAAREALSVRPVGAGHALTGLAVTDGVMLDLSALDRLRSVDPDTGLVVVEAGIRLRRLWDELGRHGLDVETLSGFERQSLGGAIATGEHGTGLAFGGIASHVRALELVTADARVVTCSEQNRPELFQAARVGLGAFGVVTAVTLACTRSGSVVRRDERVARDRCLDEADELLETHDHVEFTWFPHEDGVVRTTVDRLPAVPAQPGRARWWTVLDGEPEVGPIPAQVRGTVREAALGAARGAAARLGAVLPAALPGRRTPTTARVFSDRSYRTLALRSRVAERESEYALPRACFGAAFEEVRALIQAGGGRFATPLRVRFGAAEDSWLAMNQGRETCYLSVAASRHQPYQALFRGVESIAARYDGRPHWGRLHGLQAATLRARYPRFDDACAVRDRVDPDRRFTNQYLRRVLGD